MNDQYLNNLINKLVSILIERPSSFEDLVRNCEGAFPTIVLEALGKVASNYRVLRTQEELLVLDHRPNQNESEHFAIDTIEGNPILSSWYFTKNTCRRIGLMMDWAGLKLAFLGTPKLYEWFSHHGLGQERFLLDLDPLVLTTMLGEGRKEADHVIPYDAQQPVPQDLEARFDCVFFDPPWYVSDYIVWLARALDLAPSGKIFFSLLPSLTRPRAVVDRSLILDQCRRACENLFVFTELLDYETPTFEKAQLSAAGLSGLKSWKLADLVLLNRTHPVEQSQFSYPNAASNAEHWTEVDVGSMRFFLLDRTSGIPNQFLLQSLPGSSIVLKSPSRREPSRAEANVLTSRGHGLYTPDPPTLRRTLRELSWLLESGRSYDEAVTILGLDSSTIDVLRFVLVSER